MMAGHDVLSGHAAFTGQKKPASEEAGYSNRGNLCCGESFVTN
jgi:hypothetical protein